MAASCTFLKRFTQNWNGRGRKPHPGHTFSDSLDVGMLVLFFGLGPLANVCEKRLIDSTWLHSECPAGFPYHLKSRKLEFGRGVNQQKVSGWVRFLSFVVVTLWPKPTSIEHIEMLFENFLIFTGSPGVALNRDSRVFRKTPSRTLSQNKIFIIVLLSRTYLVWIYSALTHSQFERYGV